MLDLLPDQLPAIEAHIIRLGWIPPNARLSNPRPAGEGNMNRTLRIDCTNAANQTSIILKQAVPFVAKYPDIPAPIERGAAEAAFYHAAQNHAALEARLPRLLGTDKANHLLAFEDLGHATDLVVAYSDLAWQARLTEVMPALLEWLSALHAVSPPDLVNQCMRELNHTHIFDLPLQPNNGLELGDLSGLARQFAEDKALTQRATELGAIYIGTAQHASTPVLLHGDFYPGSWMAEAERPDQVKVIDPEFAFVGPAEFDVGVCLAHLQFAGMNLDAARRCFEHYQPPQGFDWSLADGFAGIELIRRLLGVAQLPLPVTAGAARKTEWLATGRALLLGTNP